MWRRYKSRDLKDFRSGRSFSVNLLRPVEKASAIPDTHSRILSNCCSQISTLTFFQEIHIKF